MCNKYSVIYVFIFELVLKLINMVMTVVFRYSISKRFYNTCSMYVYVFSGNCSNTFLNQYVRYTFDCSRVFIRIDSSLKHCNHSSKYMFDRETLGRRTLNMFRSEVNFSCSKIGLIYDCEVGTCIKMWTWRKVNEIVIWMVGLWLAKCKSSSEIFCSTVWCN